MRPVSYVAATKTCCHSKGGPLSPWTGCDIKGEGCGERKKERDWRVLLSLVACWFLSNVGASETWFTAVPPCCVNSTSFQSMMTSGELWKEELNWFSFSFPSSHRRSSTGEVSLSIRSHVACVLNLRKT